MEVHIGTFAPTDHGASLAESLLTKPKTSTNDDDEQPKVTSAIGEHLLNNTKCLDKYDRSMFRIVCRAGDKLYSSR